ncbi:MAG: hypothetical protein EPN17_14510 [Methylobacter sp.]|nr:MAG: hypothetical protein EPN17_14510 [Methylobacter sp.]
MNFSSVLIVTYGRSGSTLLQGLLNSIDGCLIRGENHNFCYGLFKAYEAITNTKNHYDNETKSFEATHPWYGAALLDENRFIEDARKLVLNQLNPDALQLNCIGFKEIRYVDCLTRLGEYLNFLEKLFPNPAFIALTRDHDQVMSSGWWQKRQDAKKTEARLTEFEEYISYYGKNKNNVFHIDYSDMINQTQNLQKMFEFVGVPYNKAAVENVLSIPHSYKTKPEESVTTHTLQVEQVQQPIVQYARIDESPLQNLQTITITVSGVVVLKADSGKDGVLIATDGEHEYPVSWKISSPLIREKFPENPNARYARFRVEHLQITTDRAIDIYFEDELANRYLLFKILLKETI